MGDRKFPSSICQYYYSAVISFIRCILWKGARTLLGANSQPFLLFIILSHSFSLYLLTHFFSLLDCNERILWVFLVGLRFVSIQRKWWKTINVIWLGMNQPYDMHLMIIHKFFLFWYEFFSQQKQPLKSCGRSPQLGSSSPLPNHTSLNLGNDRLNLLCTSRIQFG